MLNQITPPGTKIQWAVILRWAGTLVSTGLFIWLIMRQNWDVVIEKASGIPLWVFVFCTVCFLITYWFNTLRWCCLLWTQNIRITIWQAYRINLAGSFASNFLPSTIGGDGFRMIAIHPYTSRKSISIGSVILDRIINMSAMACLLPAPLIIFGGSLLSIIKSSSGSGVSPALIFIPKKLQQLFEKSFPKIISAFQMWSSKPTSFLYAFLAAWPSNLVQIVPTWMLVNQLGMQASFWQITAIHTIVYFLSVLPISVNGYGLREVAFITLYTSLGATLEQASTLAVITRFLMVISTVPGAIWLSSAITQNLDE